MVVVDSSVWIDYFHGKSTWQVDCLEIILTQKRVVIGDLIIIEILQGAKTKKAWRQIEKIISYLSYKDMLGKNLAYKSAKNYRYLQSKGYTVRKSIDVMIGTFCLENNYTLLHNDKDFIPLEKELGLKSINAN